LECRIVKRYSVIMKATGSFATCLLVSVGRNSSGAAFPGQPNYAALVSPYNLDLLTTPAAIVFPQNAAQVAAAVKCAVNAGIKVQAKSGGHNYGNFGSSTGELSVNLENPQDFSMDRTTWMAKFGPGNRLGQVTELMYNNGGRQAPQGETFDVGLGGHATVGGAGAASRGAKEIEVATTFR
jgi:FAD/FMN-containing dehydrogenase